MADSPWMLGNCNGTRSELANAGYDFTLKYVGELGSNLSGAYDRTPDNAKPSNGFKPFISGSQGTTFPFEVIWKGRLNDLAAECHAGYYYGKLDTQDTYKDAQGNPAALTGAPYREHISIDGWWLSAQQQLTRAGDHPDRGLHGFANVTHNNPSSNMIGNLLQAGLIYRGPTASRPRDTIGVGVSRFQANTDFRRNAQLINTLNQVTSIRDPRYVPIQDREYSFEVNYGYQATGWLMIRPNRQYVRYPGGMREVDDAVVVGVQVITDL